MWFKKKQKKEMTVVNIEKITIQDKEFKLKDLFIRQRCNHTLYIQNPFESNGVTLDVFKINDIYEFLGYNEFLDHIGVVGYTRPYNLLGDIDFKYFGHSIKEIQLFTKFNDEKIKDNEIKKLFNIFNDIRKETIIEYLGLKK